MTLTDADRHLLAQAVELAFLCPPSDRAFAVGCVIADKDGAVITTGYSRADGGGGHAEEIAIARASAAGMDLRGCTLYSSLEPCHPRLSGKTSCAQHIIDAGIARVVFALREPPVFVACAGAEALLAAGIVVVEDISFREQVAAANPGLF